MTGVRLPDTMPASGLDRLAERFALSKSQCRALARYGELLLHWNRTINLISRKETGDLWERHMLDSAQLLTLLPEAPAGRPLRIADLGSGGGFPGMVLAILGAGAVTLVESDQRKAAFLREVSRETGARTDVKAERIEVLGPLLADCVTARALAPLPKLLGYAARHLLPDGRALLLKGRSREEELMEASSHWSMKVIERPSLSDPEGAVLIIEDLAATLSH